MRTILSRAEPPAITTIDCRYAKREKYAAAYMLDHDKEVAFVDNNTNDSIPLLVSALKQKNLSLAQVKYIIVTHIHLDHSGGTSSLAKLCPNAKVLAHPRAAPHLVDPSRIITGARAVYGETKFQELYGDIEPITSEKVVEIADGTTLTLGSSELEFIHTRGHARHHMVIYDKATKSVFTGDAFGVTYLPFFKKMGARNGIIFPSSSPIDFEPKEAHISVDKIIATGAERAYPTHFGVWDDMSRGAELLHHGIDYFEGILEETKGKLLKMEQGELVMTKDELQQWGEERQRQFFTELLKSDGIEVTEKSVEVWDMLNSDIELNAAGIIVAAQRELKSRKSTE